MSFSVAQYIESVTPVSGKCLNTECHQTEWTGYKFEVRSGIEEYKSIEDWRDDAPVTIEYVYRDFLRGCPDVVSAEFQLWGGGYGVGDRVYEALEQGGFYMVIDVLKKKEPSTLTLIERIALYIDKNGDEDREN
jgi:hypothetical protein